MFDDFDYKKALGGGGKLVKGVVKAVSPDAGPGVDEAGGGLGDILKAAGVERACCQTTVIAEQQRRDVTQKSTLTFLLGVAMDAKLCLGKTGMWQSCQ